MSKKSIRRAPAGHSQCRTNVADKVVLGTVLTPPHKIVFYDLFTPGKLPRQAGNFRIHKRFHRGRLYVRDRLPQLKSTAVFVNLLDISIT